MTNATGLFDRGHTFHGPTATIDTANYGQSIGLEGHQKLFDDVTPGTSGVKTKRSNRQICCVLTRNVSGVTLEAKRVVKWQAGQRYKRVDGYCAVDFEEVAGVVDEHIGTAGVRNGDLFWLVRRGPCLIKTSLAGDATNNFAEAALLVALTAVTSQSTTSGRIQPFVATSNLTNAVSNLLNKIGRAISAKTTANSNADCLVDLELMP